MRLRPRLRRWCDGLGGYIAVAVVCLLFSIAGVAVELQDHPSNLRWRGDHVSAYTEGGIAYYSYRGEEYTLAATGVPAGSPREPATVYFNPDDPYDAWLYTRWADVTTGLYVVFPLLLAFGSVALGVGRRAAIHRRQLRMAALPVTDTYGRGLDEGFVLRALSNMRRPGRSLDRP